MSEITKHGHDTLITANEIQKTAEMQETIYQAMHRIVLTIDNEMEEFIREETVKRGFLDSVTIRKFNIEKIADAIKKRIAKKPGKVEVFIDDVLKLGICPTCESGVNSDMYYCDKCGQALDWRGYGDD